MATPKMHKMRYPIETEEAKKFWASRHKCNRIKAIIAFSKDAEEANNNLRRFGYQVHLRLRALNAWQNYVDMPDMSKVPFTPLDIPWWDCLPRDPVAPPTGKWALWMDDTNWADDQNWVEWIENPVP